MARWLERWNAPAQIIVESIGGAIDMKNVTSASTHAITMPPEFLRQLMDRKVLPLCCEAEWEMTRPAELARG